MQTYAPTHPLTRKWIQSFLLRSIRGDERYLRNHGKGQKVTRFQVAGPAISIAYPKRYVREKSASIFCSLSRTGELGDSWRPYSSFFYGDVYLGERVSFLLYTPRCDTHTTTATFVVAVRRVLCPSGSRQPLPLIGTVPAPVS